MAEADPKGETKWHKVGGVQVYARRDEQGRPTRVDAIDEDEAEIRRIADTLQKGGYGVLRERVPRKGRVYHRLNALWVGHSNPPEDPFSDS